MSHPLHDLFYDDDGQRGSHPEWEELPIEFRRLLVRCGRLQRFLGKLADSAPTVVLREERRMVAEAAMALMAYVQAEVLDPAAALCEQKEDAHLMERITVHMEAEHDHVFHPSVTLPLRIQLHETLHEGDVDGVDDW